jgi:hypothetical protein
MVEDIKPEYSAVQSDKIINICIKIKGKTDKVAQNMILWAYDDAPLFCPIRHLMTYIHICEIKEGYLFPNLKKRSEPRNYENVMLILNTRFTNVLHRYARLTTHSFRKTGYLFALWGGADLQTARVSARHKSDIMAQRYADCSLFLLQTATAKDPNAKYVVGRFKMAINIHPESSRTLNEDSTNVFHNLYQLSQLFVEQIGISIHHGGRLRLRTVMKHALAFQPVITVEAELEKVLSQFSNETKQCISQLFSKMKHSYLNECARLRRELEGNTAINTTITAAALPDSLSNVEPSLRVAKRKRGGDENIDEIRREIKQLKGRSRLDLLVTIPGKVEFLHLTESARIFMQKCVLPVLRCLDLHFHNDHVAFLGKWPLTGSISNFKKTCCNCNENTCGV